jgi:putative tryptophan/tyrosine transport system substrate-binding protein
VNGKIASLAFCALLLTLSIPAAAQQAKKVHRVGYLSVLSPSSDSTRMEAFLQGLRELGYVEGKHITLEGRNARGQASSSLESGISPWESA